MADLQSIVKNPVSARWAFQMLWAMLFAARAYAKQYKGKWSATYFFMGPYTQTPAGHDDAEMQFQHLDVRVVRVKRGDVDAFMDGNLAGVARGRCQVPSYTVA